MDQDLAHKAPTSHELNTLTMEFQILLVWTAGERAPYLHPTQIFTVTRAIHCLAGIPQKHRIWGRDW